MTWRWCAAQKLQPCPVCQAWRGGGTELEGGRQRKIGGAQGRRGPLSEEHREKIRASNAGRKRRPLDEEHKQ